MARGNARETARAWLCRGLLAAGVIAGDPMAMAEPIPLPYRSREPFIPVIELFGGARRGLVLSAEEADSGRPAPISIGNTTFYPQVRRAGSLYGGYTSVKGDLQILDGDLYLQDQPVGGSIKQLQVDNLDLRVQARLHDRRLTTVEGNTAQMQQSLSQTQQSLTEAQQAINQNQQSIGQQQQSIQQLNQSVESLGQVANQQADALAEHGQAINSMAADLSQAQDDIQRLEQNVSNLGGGVAGATALIAALASLPNEPGAAPVACGVGSGGYSDRYALAMGCSVSLNAALSINAGGAYLFGGSRSYGSGSLNNVAGSLGLAYRFGNSQRGGTSRRQTSAAIEQELQSIKADNQQLRQLISVLSQRMEDLRPAAQAAGIR